MQGTSNYLATSDAIVEGSDFYGPNCIVPG
jgi:hypothetical protein